MKIALVAALLALASPAFAGNGPSLAAPVQVPNRSSIPVAFGFQPKEPEPSPDAPVQVPDRSSIPNEVEWGFLPEDAGRVQGLKHSPWAYGTYLPHSNAPLFRLEFHMEKFGTDGRIVSKTRAGITSTAFNWEPIWVTNDKSYVSDIRYWDDGSVSKTTKVFRSGVQMVLSPVPKDDGTLVLRYRAEGIDVTGHNVFKGLDLYSFSHFDVSGSLTVKAGEWFELETGGKSPNRMWLRVLPLSKGCEEKTPLCL